MSGLDEKKDAMGHQSTCFEIRWSRPAFNIAICFNKVILFLLLNSNDSHEFLVPHSTSADDSCDRFRSAENFSSQNAEFK